MPAICNKSSDTIGGAEDANLMAEQGGGPTGIEVISVEVGETDGGDVGGVDAGGGKTGGGDARADAAVDEEQAGRCADGGAVPGGAAGQNAEFDRHPCAPVMRSDRLYGPS